MKVFPQWVHLYRSGVSGFVWGGAGVAIDVGVGLGVGLGICGS